MPDPLAVPLAILSALHGALDVLCLEFRQGTVHVLARSKHSIRRCPDCGTRSERAHGSYVRRLADLAHQSTPVCIRLQVQRFRCLAPRCPRRTFTERLPAFAPEHARRTGRLTELIGRVGMSVGGETAARLLPTLGAATSADTVLRVLRRMPIPPRPTPRVLGVDEWAWRKGHTYGTILVDLERHAAVDLLPHRSADSFARWLVEHPGVEIITRDRSEIYAEGARRGAPNAVQVADRWHLLKNLSDLVERVLQRHRKELDRAAASATETAPEHREDTASTLPSPSPPPASSSSRTKVSLPRQHWYEQIHALRQKGLSVHGISRELHLSRPTVRKYLMALSCPARAPRRTKLGALSAFDDHLRARWAEGCRDAMLLWRELQARGFRGSYRTVQRHVARWRAQHPSAPPSPRAPSPRQARWWLLMPEARRSPKQSRFVQALIAQCETIATAHAQAVEFARILRAHDIEALSGWMTTAMDSTLQELRDFAEGLRRDEAAVRAAVALPWSNGQTEGQVNRLKVLKRQMYGRASLGLLRQRLLYAA